MTSINAMEVPVSTIQSATAASYTIPADRYAIIRAGVHKGGTLSINGTVVLYSELLTWDAIKSVQTPEIWLDSSASQNSLRVTGGNSTPSTYVNPVFANNTASAFSSPHETTFKVPPGTVVVGTGTARYHIELYRVPGSAT